MIWINEQACGPEYCEFGSHYVLAVNGRWECHVESSEMKRTRRLIGATSCVATWLVAGGAGAQDIGQPAMGRVVAQQICSECHAIEKAQARSPNAAAPRFEVIANTPGMTATALAAALQTPHRTMPNVMLELNDLSNVIAYVLSLRQGN